MAVQHFVNTLHCFIHTCYVITGHRAFFIFFKQGTSGNIFPQHYTGERNVYSDLRSVKLKVCLQTLHTCYGMISNKPVNVLLTLPYSMALPPTSALTWLWPSPLNWPQAQSTTIKTQPELPDPFNDNKLMQQCQLPDILYLFSTTKIMPRRKGTSPSLNRTHNNKRKGFTRAAYNEGQSTSFLTLCPVFTVHQTI